MVEQISISSEVSSVEDVPYRIARVLVDFENDIVKVSLKSITTPARVEVEYVKSKARDLSKLINKGDFSTTSIKKWLLQKMVNDSKVNGKVSGDTD